MTQNRVKEGGERSRGKISSTDHQQPLPWQADMLDKYYHYPCVPWCENAGRHCLASHCSVYWWDHIKKTFFFPQAVGLKKTIHPLYMYTYMYALIHTATYSLNSEGHPWVHLSMSSVGLRVYHYLYLARCRCQRNMDGLPNFTVMVSHAGKHNWW